MQYCHMLLYSLHMNLHIAYTQHVCLNAFRTRPDSLCTRLRKL
jgi:hypothetical protein